MASLLRKGLIFHLQRTTACVLTPKRTYSSDSNHVLKYIPGMKLDQTPSTAWYFQELNPLLSLAGELKVVIANKNKILSRVICRPVLQNLDNIMDEEETVEQLLWAIPLGDMKMQ
jgi:hypothetical protein